MSTPRLDPQDRSELIRRIRAGEVFVLPTDTAYGLGASLEHPEAVSRVFEIKERSREKTLPVLTTADSLRRRVDLTAVEDAAIEAFWPGPLTLVVGVEDPDSYPDGIVRSRTIAVREPAHEPLLALLREAGPVTGTSANRAGEPTPGSIGELDEDIVSAVDFVLDGPAVEGEGSTVAEWKSDRREWVIHRAGAVSREDLRNVTNDLRERNELS